MTVRELRNIIAGMKAVPVQVARSRYQCPLCYRELFGKLARCPSCGLPFEYERGETDANDRP
jgi:transposase-like protein